MGVPANATTTKAINGATATGVLVKTNKRGILNRIFVHETSAVGGSFTVDVYNKEVSLAGLEATRAPFRVMERLTSSTEDDYGGIEAVGQFELDVPFNTPGGALYVVITPAGAGSRVFSIAVTTTGPILA